MAVSEPRIVRCAIYTRKSSDEGLDQAFNSLHAQREACEAYVKSQAHEGWRALATAYDDGGVSGGTMDRPALQQLLADVDAGFVDTIVVYKIDRLTRSLTDFGRIVERLEAKNASFVSVTQAFNTTTSMGRLTLNVLLSFAQFEREVTGERIRDKIKASKRKGMWMGGWPPLGYDAPVDRAARALVVNEYEAETVRFIFRTYLELGSAPAVLDVLNAKGIRSKQWTTQAGRQMGGYELGRGGLYKMLQNRTYLGEIPHGSESYPGAHPAILPIELFNAVQARLTGRRHARQQEKKPTSKAPLRGLLFDLDGHVMSPSGNARHRYYTSAPLLRGRKCEPKDGAIRRVAAGALEEKLREELVRLSGVDATTPLLKLLPSVRRIELSSTGARVSVLIKALPTRARSQVDQRPDGEGVGDVFLPMVCRLRGGRTWVASPDGRSPLTRRDPVLIRGLRQAHRLAANMGWRMADAAVADVEVKAPASAYERKLCRLAFLAPDIQAAIMRGHQPGGLTLESLLRSEIPLAWPEQRKAFGFS